jgi:hypothetical protein
MCSWGEEKTCLPPLAIKESCSRTQKENSHGTKEKTQLKRENRMNVLDYILGGNS